MSDAPKPDNQWSAPGSSHNEDAAGNTYRNGPGQDYGAPQEPHGHQPQPGYQPQDYNAPGYPQGYENSQGHQPQPGYQPQAYNEPQGYDPAPGYGGSQGYQPGYPQTYGAPGYQPGYAGPQRMTWSQVKPGIVPIRPLGVGDMIGGAFALIRFNAKATLGMTFVMALVAGVVMFGLGALVDVLNLSIFGDYMGLLPMATITSSLALQAIIALVMGPLTIVTIHAVRGNKISPSQAWAEFRPHLGKYLLYYLIMLVGIALFTGLFFALLYVALTYVSNNAASLILTILVAFAALAIYAYFVIKLMAGVPAVSIEGLGPIQAIGRSWKLLEGGFWRSFGAYILMYIITQFLSSVIIFPIMLLAGVGGALYVETFAGFGGLTAMGTTLAQVLAIIVTAPLTGALVGLVYVNQRIRKEGYDIELLGNASR